ncbi:MAG: hypothetical protein RIR39_1558 [Pseudomonadota bacterium]|jgi:hypothetical protein
MFVIPVGATVPDPDRNDFLPIEGREVEAKQYWYRRIETGEVTESLSSTANAEPSITGVNDDSTI